MSWLRIDDGFSHHPKVLALTVRERWDWLTVLCYCARYQTSGSVVRSSAKAIGVSAKTLDRFVEVGLLDTDGAELTIHDWGLYNPGGTNPTVTPAERASSKRRVELYRDPTLRKAIRERDGDWCRYCDAEVNWNDRKGATGATYDHVDPEGPNAIENLVVCCRSCNARKHKRTPEAAGMKLLPPHISHDLDQNLDPNLEIDQDPSRARASRPVPSPSPEGLADLSALPGYVPVEGHEEKLWRRLCVAAGARTRPDIAKLERTVSVRKSTHREMECAIDAATGPGVKDPLAVALSELVKRHDERSADA